MTHDIFHSEFDKAQFTKEDLERYNSMLARDLWREMRTIFEKRVAEVGLTQQELAERLGVNKSVISKRLKGSCNMTLNIISEMARALNCKPVICLTPYEDLLSVSNSTHQYRPTRCVSKSVEPQGIWWKTNSDETRKTVVLR